MIGNRVKTKIVKTHLVKEECDRLKTNGYKLVSCTKSEPYDGTYILRYRADQ